MRVLKECNGDVDNAAYRLIEIKETGNEAVFNFYDNDDEEEEEEERNSITFLQNNILISDKINN